MMAMQEVQKTPFARSTQITIAGGITTEADLAALDALGVEGQVVPISLLLAIYYCYFKSFFNV
jgi:phosphoribosylformimino-5-aminoimidazole carboxamide ribonucleotide (ProFAR) isomerase